MCLCNRCMVGIVMIFEHRNLSLCVGERALPSLIIHTQWSTVPALVFLFYDLTLGNWVDIILGL